MEKLLHQYKKTQERLENYGLSAECSQKDRYLIEKTIQYCKYKGNEKLKKSLNKMDPEIREKFSNLYNHFFLSGSSVDCFVDLLFGTPDSAANLVKSH